MDTYELRRISDRLRIYIRNNPYQLCADILHIATFLWYSSLYITYKFSNDFFFIGCTYHQSKMQPQTNGDNWQEHSVNLVDDLLNNIQIDDACLIAPLNDNIFSMASEKMWYPHKYEAYDQKCKGIRDVIAFVQEYINSGVSTPVFEAEKFIMFNKLVCLVYVLNKFDIPRRQDWEHLAACCIINCNDCKFLVTVIDYYAVKHPEDPRFSVDPDVNELLWLCLKVGNVPAFCVLLQYGVFNEQKWEPYITHSMYEEDPKSFLKRISPSDELLIDPTNPRNLAYALFDKDMNLAQYLVEEGCAVDVWNNFPMKLIITSDVMKKNKELTTMMFAKGAKIPPYYLEVKRRTQATARQIVNQMYAKTMTVADAIDYSPSPPTPFVAPSYAPPAETTLLSSESMMNSVSKEFSDFTSDDWTCSL